MKLKVLDFNLTICKITSPDDMDWSREFYIAARTDEEFSLVCKTIDTPAHTAERSDGWRAFRIEGTLDFSLTGILARLTAILAEQKIGIFAVSTYNTDYLLVKSDSLKRALDILREKGYDIS